MEKLPLIDGEKIKEIARAFSTPFHLFDEAGMRENTRSLLRAFSWNEGFKEYFAVKATPNPTILKILHAEGLGMDCSSMAELVLAERVGITGEDIMFTSNNTPAAEFKKAAELGGIINLDDLSHLGYLEQYVGLPPMISFRYNPGPLKEGNVLIGKPEEAKFGCTREQLFEGYRLARDKGVTRFGLHTMVAANELNPAYFVETTEILFNLIAEISAALDIRFEFVNIGGGLGLPYKPDDTPIDIEALSQDIRAAYHRIIEANGLAPLKLFLECGRYITGPFGYLVSRVRHIKQTYKTYAGLDANMVDLMRPGIYGAYHHITVVDKETAPADTLYDVTGSLCENNDKFAVNRKLPRLDIGDLVVLHDSGAHGHSMGSNYNGKLRSAELLLRSNGDVCVIRRAETLGDYFATLDFEDVHEFEV